MPVSKGCSYADFKANLRELSSSGYEGTQLKAVAISALKKACGVPRDEKHLSVKEILARGGALKEMRETGEFHARTRAHAWATIKLVSEGVAGAKVLENALTRWPSLVVTTVAKSAMERVGLDEGISGRDGSFRGRWISAKRLAEGFSSSSRKGRNVVMFDSLMMEISEDRNRDGAVRRDEFDTVQSVHADLSVGERTSAEAHVWDVVPDGRKLKTADGKEVVVYLNRRGLAVEAVLDDMDDDELMWLAASTGFERPDSAPEPLGDLSVDEETLDLETDIRGILGEGD